MCKLKEYFANYEPAFYAATHVMRERFSNIYNVTTNPSDANIRVNQIDISEDAGQEGLIMENCRENRGLIITTEHMGRLLPEYILGLPTCLQPFTVNPSRGFMQAAPVLRTTDWRERNLSDDSTAQVRHKTIWALT